MENSRLNSLRLIGLILCLGGLLLAAAGCSWPPLTKQEKQVLSLELEPEITPWTVMYRYRFGGEIVTHFLDGVSSVTVYQRADAERPDQVVFNLKSGRDYVLNEDILVDYKLLPDSEIVEHLELNKLYHHYDPYLQGYKQDKHQEWVNEQYQEYAGRLPTEAEWIEALNELTRGVEHHQMQRWIQYSPPSIGYFINHLYSDDLIREPSDVEWEHIFTLLLSGLSYEDLKTAMIN